MSPETQALKDLHPDPQTSSKHAAGDKIDQQQVDIETIEIKVNNKIDRRIKKEHNFTTTSEERIDNPLGRIPQDVIASVGTAAATIRKGSTAWTDQYIYLISSAQPNRVTLYFF